PVQLVWGWEDGIIPLSYAADWTAAVPEARLHVIDAAGHLPQVERPEEFLAATGLLDREPSGGSRWS
ncbi:MAG: hypothetical protein Q7T71_02645, partial [Herbiconiux sp.]|nr:hypothetical protein [Herbiconiux sp.]